ncbi:MAG: hypothetical protein KAT70_05360 [Thermoplasmata archaeon]|nr:hypothetical protein [Thermoplasmata archaeon]
MTTTDTNENVVLFLMSGDHPYTTGQITKELHMARKEIMRTLRALEKLNYLHMAPVSPNLDMIVPMNRLLKMSVEEKDELCETLEKEELENGLNSILSFPSVDVGAGREE